MKVSYAKDMPLSALISFIEFYTPYSAKNPSWDRTGLDKLIAMDRSNVTKEQVDSAIGNTSWTSHTCDECGKESDVLVYMGDLSEDHEARYLTLCKKCLAAALKMVKG